MSSLDRPELVSFANHVIGDWENAMERFLSAVDRKASARGMSDEDIRAALLLGYGGDVVDAWLDWVSDGAA